MYLALKALHVLGVILFLGNVITGLFWKRHAERGRDPRAIAHAFEGIIRSDRAFTLPGVAIILVTGVVAAMVGGLPILGTGWILWSLVLFLVSGAVFMARVAPLQQRILALARDRGEAGAIDWPRYQALATAWERWGLLSVVTPLVAVALMVLKPALPGL